MGIHWRTKSYYSTSYLHDEHIEDFNAHVAIFFRSYMATAYIKGYSVKEYVKRMNEDEKYGTINYTTVIDNASGYFNGDTRLGFLWSLYLYANRGLGYTFGDYFTGIEAPLFVIKRVLGIIKNGSRLRAKKYKPKVGVDGITWIIREIPELKKEYKSIVKANKVINNKLYSSEWFNPDLKPMSKHEGDGLAETVDKPVLSDFATSSAVGGTSDKKKPKTSKKRPLKKDSGGSNGISTDGVVEEVSFGGIIFEFGVGDSGGSPAKDVEQADSLEGSEGVVNRVQEKEKEKPKRKFGDLSGF